jgi:predicted Zn-dependent protease
MEVIKAQVCRAALVCGILAHLGGAQTGLQRAIELTRKGEFREAIPLFLAAHDQGNKDYALRFNLALCYVGTAQWPPALELLSELRTEGRGNAQVENLLAQALLGAQQSAEAWEAFARSVQLEPANEKLYVYMADACLASGHYELGLQVAEAGRKQFPRSARLAFERGMFLIHLDFLDDAKKNLQEAARLEPGSDIAYVAATQKSLLDGRVADAVRVAGEGIRQGKQHVMLLGLYGEAVLRLGAEPGGPEFAAARGALEQAVALRPTYPSTQLGLGKLYLREGRWDEAIARLEAARELDARNPAVFSHLAIAYRRRGDTQKAEQMLAILVRLNQAQVDRIRSAPGDRKPGYASKRVQQD